MASDWPLISLGEIVAIRSGFAFKSSDWRDVGIPVIKIANVKPGAIDLGDCSYVSREIAATARGFDLSSGDIVVAMTGYVGEVARATSKDLPAVVNQRVGKLEFKGNGRADPDFLYAFLRLNSTRAMMESLAHGSAQPNLSAAHFHSIKLNLPPLEIQHGIGALARSLDNRIDHNRALAANLEAIARALFKAWFVDFDPVRAKAAGEAPPGLASDLADLFPDRFVDSELGEIPEGWSTVALSQLAEVERGLSYKGSGLADRDSGKPMHNLNSVLEGGGYKYAGIKYYSGEYKARHIAKAGDIVVANTEQGHKHLLIGFPAIIPASYAEGLFSHHLYRVRLLRDTEATKHWLYYALMAPDVREQIIGHANGSTVNMLKPTGLQVPLVVLPPMKLCEKFDALAESIRARIENCVAESTALAELRDLLLPRLISGKLRVEDAEAALEAA